MGQNGADFDFNVEVLKVPGGRYSAAYWRDHPFAKGGTGGHFENRYMNTWGGINEENQPRYIYLGYGDDYPNRTDAGATWAMNNSTFSNFLEFQGPGNTNPGNYWQNDQMTPAIRQYIAKQFKYILFDMESFAVRHGSNPPVLDSIFAQQYYTEADNLYAINANAIIMHYFCPTFSQPQYPGYRADKRLMRQGSAITFRDASNLYLMDISDQEWQNNLADAVLDRVTRGHFTGIFLDNFTRYPLISESNFDWLDSHFDLMANWGTYLSEIVTKIRTRLNSSSDPRVRNIKIICSSLGIDDNPPRPLYGDSYGVDVINQSGADGGFLEPFRSAAWSVYRDAVPTVMANMSTIGKIFITVASYTYGDGYINQQFALGKQTGDFYSVEGADQEYYVPAWNPIFYRFQQSYLARFLLGIQATNSTMFAFSYQPGFLGNYQFVPYYSIWNSNFGNPQGNYTTFYSTCPELPVTPDPNRHDSLYNDPGYVYLRAFGNTEVVVNKEDHGVTVKLQFSGYNYTLYNQNNNTPGGPYIYGLYYGSYNGANYLVLNKNEGIVLFKGSRIIQQDRSDEEKKMSAKQVVTEYSLEQAYPDPFNPTTKISYSIPEITNVTIIVYDRLGRKVETLVNNTREPGYYDVTFDARRLPSGIYFYTIKAGSYVTTRKMVLLK